MITLKRLLVLLTVVLLLSSCESYDTTAKKRRENAAAATGEIVIGIVDTKGEFSFAKGAKLAVVVINQQGGVLGRAIRIIEYDDEGDVPTGQKIAKNLALNKDVLAVVGHIYSRVALPASITYNLADVVFLSPEATNPNLTRYGLWTTFRNSLISEESGRQLAEYAYTRGFKKMAILYHRTNSFRRLAETFHERALEQGIEIVTRRSYSDSQTYFSDLIAEIQDYQFDAIFLAGEDESAAQLIRQAKTMGISQPFMGGEGLDTPRLWQVAGKAAEGTIVPSLFNPKLLSRRTQEFVKRFEAAYGTPPNSWDAQGYDAVQVLAHAIEKGGSTIPQTISTTLRFLENWESVSGTYSFTHTGDITGRDLFFKEVRGGKFEFLEREQVVYQLTEQTLKNMQSEGVPAEVVEILTSEGDPQKEFTQKEAFLKTVETLIGSERTAKNQELILKYARAQKVEEYIDPLYVIKDITLQLPLKVTPNTLDPALSEESEIAGQLFLGLTEFNPETFEVYPELADWTVSSDKLTYRFSLRQDAYWTDGVPVTAEDVYRTVLRNLQPDTPIPHKNVVTMLYPLKNARLIHENPIQVPLNIRPGVRVVDKYTIEFTLETPLPYFPVLAASDLYRPLPWHIIHQYGDSWADFDHIQTNGPYRLKYWDKEVVMILRKNSKYYDAATVSIPEIRFYSISTPSVGMTMYREGRLDVLGGKYLAVPEDEIPQIRANPGMRDQLTFQSASEVYFLGINTARPPMNNPLVRKALIAAIDRQLVTNLLKGGLQAATTISPPAVFGAVPSSKNIGISFDLEQARQWLAEAGYPNGRNFPTLVLASPWRTKHPYFVPIQTLLKQYLNITVTFKSPMDSLADNTKAYHQFLTRIEPPHLFMYQYTADYPDADNFLGNFFHPDSLYSLNQFLNWENAEFNELITSALQHNAPNIRKEKYTRAEQILCNEDAVVIPYLYNTTPLLIHPRVTGWTYNPVWGQYLKSWSFEE